MGQDREFNDEQRRFVLETVQAFRIAWEKAEYNNLVADRDKRIAYKERDIQAEIDQNTTLFESLENQVETTINARPQEDFIDDTHVELASEQERLKLQSNWFKEVELWKNWLTDICSLHTIKLPRIVQSLNFLLGQ